MPGHRPSNRIVAVLLAVAAILAACGPGASSPAADGRLRVVTSTTVLADLVANVGGEHVVVDPLVPKGGEVHTFDPTPSDVRRVTDAGLVLVNGLGLDGWLADLVTGSGTEAPVVALGEDLEGVEYLEGAHDEEVNPHLWLNVAYAARYADRIAEQLRLADPSHAADYDAGLASYRTELETLDESIRGSLAAIPSADRTVIAFHDAFPYFAEAYGLRVDGTIVDAPGQDPSAGEISDLIRVVETNGVRVILAEAQFNDDLARTIADETGAVVVSDLLTESTGDPPQDSYVGAMRWNVEQIVAALTGG